MRDFSCIDRSLLTTNQYKEENEVNVDLFKEKWLFILPGSHNRKEDM
jgi:hypothetical protein